MYRNLCSFGLSAKTDGQPLKLLLCPTFLCNPGTKLCTKLTLPCHQITYFNAQIFFFDALPFCTLAAGLSAWHHLSYCTIFESPMPALGAHSLMVLMSYSDLNKYIQLFFSVLSLCRILISMPSNCCVLIPQKILII